MIILPPQFILLVPEFILCPPPTGAPSPAHRPAGGRPAPLQSLKDSRPNPLLAPLFVMYSAACYSLRTLSHCVFMVSVCVRATSIDPSKANTHRYSVDSSILFRILCITFYFVIVFFLCFVFCVFFCFLFCVFLCFFLYFVWLLSVHRLISFF